MLISRRKAHLWSSIVLAIVLPLLFIVGVLFRPVYGPVSEPAEALFQQAELPATQENLIAAFLQQE
ncbi:hypothetical protein [Leptothoe sp. PORK10 BA2]|uniref:hypothetical protein n=1 Tax=Leptothoe sp. PORK10 BA2 TaxID=3110254 RepID=UPI002B1F33B0|nr:hypothetical protein [Leptothoe sp. PORK10 BA2]MEA5467092.1 hypothetical protein [Leptothoe sp. PORK10 BA2]